MRIQFKASRFTIIFFLCVIAVLANGFSAFGQQKLNMDSLRLARQRVLDSTRKEQQRRLDSAKVVRQKIADSLSSVRRHVADSLAAIRKYRESKRYKDSVATIRQQRLDSIKAARTAVFDSMKTARQKTMDSIVLARKRSTDSIKLIQKQRADSLAAIRKYKESKRYKDSVALVRQIKLDSTQQARKKITDSIATVRKRSLDSAAAVRKLRSDSIAAVRKKFTDSVAAVRKVRTDSLAKIKESKDRLKKSQEKQKEDKMKLALELKIKQKRQAWSNEKMLKKNWSVPRRVLQNTYTHYNYYFNADRKMDEALANMQRMGKEDYDSLIALFPFDPDRDSTKLAPDMDSIIRKASVGIQIHDPRTKWADDLYLLLGQAYYYKGNYSEASAAFRYIIAMNQQRKMEEQKKAAAKKKQVDKEVSILQEEKGGALDFLKHRSVNNEAILWLARTNTEAHKESDAESILELIETDKNFTDDIKGRIALEKAYLNLSRKEYSAASENLAVVATDNALPDWIRTRAAYLNGQLLYQQGNYTDAAKHFGMVVDFKPKIDLDFYARKNLAYSLIQQGGTQEEATVALRKMLNDGKYLPYHEQIYYVLGRLSGNNNKPDDAIAYYNKSLGSSKSTRKQKALSFAGLGNVYYTKGEYKTAKVNYDSAAVYGKSIANEEEIITASRRSKVLDKVVTPTEIINTQDSLLALAALPENEQRAIIRRYIRQLEKQKEDSAFRAANGDNNAKAADDGDPGGSAGAGNWYFSNAVQMQQGFNDFKRKWGNRQNVDNWRRAGNGGAVAGNNNSSSGTDNNSSSSVEIDENGLPTEASLLAVIPGTAEEQSLSRKRIQDAYIELANAYVKDLEDYEKASQTLDTLDKRFPAHDHKAEALYLRYQVALKTDKLNEAQTFSEQLRNEYSNTKWAAELAPKEDTKGLLASTVSVANYYDETYGLMMQRQYSDVLQRVREGQRQYNDPVYAKRFRIMEAIALAGVGNYGQADTLLSEFISTKPSDSLRSWADAVLNYVKKSKPAPVLQDSAGGTNAAPMQPAILPANAANQSIAPITTPNSTNTSGIAIPSAYTYKPASEHYFIFYFYKLESKTQGLKAGFGDFNRFNFSAQQLSVSLDMLKQDQGIIVVKSFPSASHAKIYMHSVRSNNLLLKEFKADEYTLMIISADNFKKLNADKDMSPYLKFFKANYK